MNQEEEKDESNCCYFGFSRLCCSCVTSCCGKAAILCVTVYYIFLSICRVLGRGCCGCISLCGATVCHCFGCCCSLTVFCGGKCGRTILTAISIIMLLLGIGVIGLGVLIYVTHPEISGGYVVVIMLVFGLLLKIVALFGLFGSWNRSAFYLFCNAFTILLLIAGVSTVFILFENEKLDINTFVESRWMELTNHEKITVQNEFDCCGFPDYDEYYGSPCPTLDELVGCGEVLEEFVKESLVEITVTGGALTTLIIVMLFFSYCVLKGFRIDKKLKVIVLINEL